MALSPASSHSLGLHAATHKTDGTDPLAASDVGAAAAAHTHAQSDVTGLAAALAAKPTGGQAAIADLNLGVLALLPDVITAVGTVQGKVNMVLAELRTAGLLLP